MPFTFAHAAIGWPMRRARLVWSAFFIGTLAPDFEYFLELAPQSGYGHHWPGIVTLSLPVGIGVFLVYESVGKRALVSILPDEVQRRITSVDPTWRNKGWRWWIRAVYSIAFGVVTHVFWDGFTHRKMWGARWFPVLRFRVPIAFGHSASLAWLLQIASSVIGMAVLAYWSWDWFHTTPPRQGPARLLAGRKGSVAILITVLASAGALLRTVFYLHGRYTMHTAIEGAVVLLVSIIALMWYQLLALGVYLKLRSAND
jgi:Domain of unknown function (DUF4184)